MTTNKENIENEEVENKIETEEKVEHPVIPPVTKYTRPPAYIKWNTQVRWNQNNFTKQVQRKASWRGR